MDQLTEKNRINLMRRHPSRVEPGQLKRQINKGTTKERKENQSQQTEQSEKKDIDESDKAHPLKHLCQTAGESLTSPKTGHPYYKHVMAEGNEAILNQYGLDGLGQNQFDFCGPMEIVMACGDRLERHDLKKSRVRWQETHKNEYRDVSESSSTVPPEMIAQIQKDYEKEWEFKRTSFRNNLKGMLNDSKKFRLQFNQKERQEPEANEEIPEIDIQFDKTSLKNDTYQNSLLGNNETNDDDAATNDDPLIDKESNYSADSAFSPTYKSQNAVSHIYVPKDNQNLVLIGFTDSSVQIRDTYTLNKILYKFKPAFEEKVKNEVVNFLFHMDNFANLCVQYKKGATFNIILSREPESLKFTEECREMIRNNYCQKENRFKEKTEFLHDGNELLLATQIENGPKSQIVLVNLEKACFDGVFDSKMIIIHGRYQKICFMTLNEGMLIIAYQEQKRPKSILVNRDEKLYPGCIEMWKLDFKDHLKYRGQEKKFNLRLKCKHQGTDHESHCIKKKRFRFPRTLNALKRKVSIVRLRYKQERCLAISQANKLEIFSLKDLSIKDVIIDAHDKQIKTIQVSPCGRILAVLENNFITIWDMQHFNKVFEQKCKPEKIKHFTNDLLLFGVRQDDYRPEFDDDSSDCSNSESQQFWALTFVDNAEASSLFGHPLKTIPLCAYLRRTVNEEIILDLDSKDYRVYQDIHNQEIALKQKNMLKQENNEEQIPAEPSTQNKVDKVKFEEYAINYIHNKKVYNLNMWDSYLYNNQSEDQNQDDKKLLTFTRKEHVFEFELQKQNKKRDKTQDPEIYQQNRTRTKVSRWKIGDKSKSTLRVRFLPFDMNRDGWLLLDDSTLFCISYDKEDKNNINYLRVPLDNLTVEPRPNEDKDMIATQFDYSEKIKRKENYKRSFISAACDKIGIVFEKQEKQKIYIHSWGTDTETAPEMHDFKDVKDSSISPDFKTTFSFKLAWESRKLNQDQEKFEILRKEDHKEGCKRFYTLDNKYAGMEIVSKEGGSQGYKIFRLADGTQVCILQKENIKLVFNNKGTGKSIKVLVGIIDLHGRKFYPWSIETLVHVCINSVNLFHTDFNFRVTDSAEMNWWLNQKILGLPMPAMYPIMLNRIKQGLPEDLGEEDRQSLMQSINLYTSYPFFGNALHFIAHENQTDALHEVFKLDVIRYFTCFKSPLMCAKPQCADIFMHYLTSTESDADMNANQKYKILQVKNIKRNIIRQFSQKGLRIITELPQQACVEYFNDLTVQVQYPFDGQLEREAYELITNTCSSSNCAFTSTQSLDYLSRGENPKTQAIFDSLFKRKEKGGQSDFISVFYFMCEFPLQPGAPDSVNLHKQLDEKPDSQMFESKTIIKYIEYKNLKVITLGYCLFAQYLVYLIFIIFLPKWYVFLFWFILHFGNEFFQFTQLADTFEERFWKYVESYWNIMDFVRLTLLLCLSIAMLLSNTNEIYKTKLRMLKILNFISWLELLYYCRFFTKLRILVYLIERTFVDMVAFMIIVLVFVFSFTYSFALLEYNENNELSFNIGSFYKSFIVQFNVLFGDFSLMQEDQFGVPEYMLFVAVTLLVPLVMLNLLVAVISETQASVNDNLQITDMYQQNSIILELEFYFQVLYKDVTKNEFLVFAELVSAYQKDSWHGSSGATTDCVRHEVEKTKDELISEQKKLMKEITQQVKTEMVQKVAKQFDNIFKEKNDSLGKQIKQHFKGDLAKEKIMDLFGKKISDKITNEALKRKVAQHGFHTLENTGGNYRELRDNEDLMAIDVENKKIRDRKNRRESVNLFKTIDSEGPFNSD